MRKYLFGVFGAGGFGREVMPLVRSQILKTLFANDSDIVFVETLPQKRRVNGVPVWSMMQFIESPCNNRYFVVAVGDPVARRKIAWDLESGGCVPYRVMGGDVVGAGLQKIERGVIACTHSLIHPNCTIGRHVHLNIYSYVAHDAVVGDFVTLAPKAAINGHVTVGEGTYIGTGAVTKEGVTIGKGVIIGAGAVVIRDVPDYVTMVGNPARMLNPFGDPPLIPDTNINPISQANEPQR